MSGAPEPLLRCRGITKRFGTLVANDAIDFDVRAGEVHAIVGENGAGKSTFMNVLYGILQPEAGTMERNGAPVKFADCAHAMRAGIGMVFQHYLLVERFSVAENVMLGREPVRGGFVERGACERSVGEIAARYRFNLDAAARVETLGVGARQQVELLKALEREPQVLILDEPTASLSPFETQGLFEVVRRLRSQGCGVIFITHKLKEVTLLSDRVTVLRRGKVVGKFETAATNEAALGALMVGGAAAAHEAAPAASPEEVVLSVRNLIVRADGREAVCGISLDLRSREIVGVAGVEGSGQVELAEALYGLRKPASGSIALGARDVTCAPTVERRRLGLRYICADRQREGLVLDFDVVENMVLGDQRLRPNELIVDAVAARRCADYVAHSFRVARYDKRAAMRNYSGGTQQKFLVGREATTEARVVIAFAPTRGVDIGAAATIYRHLQNLQAQGGAILLFSYDLDEIRALASRIFVMNAGRIAGELSSESADDATLGRLMGGSAA